ncbi:MAG: hypothetical protein HOV87_12900, partial [Catenulispora sp.]|nr:hypothetical protein [Catenulispora sp.]
MTSSTGHHAHSPQPAPASEQTRDTVAWIVVTVILLGVITTAVGLMAVQIAVICVGAGVVAVGLVLAVVLPRLGVSRPVSFAENVPTRTDGPRATDDGRSEPLIDTEPDAGRSPGLDPDRPRPPDLSPYLTFEEAPASELPQTPDVDRAKPQHVNLAPDERIRRIGGEDVIEVPDEQPPERRAGG